MLRASTILITCALFACSAESTPPPATDASPLIADVQDVQEDTAPIDTGGSLCVPNATLCYSQLQVATCNDFGTAYEAIEDCPEDTICIGAPGACTFPFCFPGSTECTDYWNVRTCDESGVFWQDAVECESEMHCKNGACQMCTPGTQECVDEQSQRQCADDGLSWLEPTSCEPAETCLEGGCYICPAGEAVCHDDKTVKVCSDNGASWNDYIACSEDELCIEGACVSCGLEKTCLTTDMVLEECTNDGVNWSQQTLCEPEHFCAKGECLYEACFSDVLLLVDRSGSMSGDWNNVKQSVTSLIDTSDFAQFALLSFPGDGSCGVAEALDVDWTLGDSTPFGVWFDDFGPNGSTPLVGALEQVYTLAPLFFKAKGGTLVVLSDGQDTCANGNEELDLMNYAAALFVNYKVTSYVIGYNFGGNAGQLNAIAANGGSAVKEYIPAGNEAELTEALNSIVTDLKLCD
jgi:hypothetical protein